MSVYHLQVLLKGPPLMNRWFISFTIRHWAISRNTLLNFFNLNGFTARLLQQKSPFPSMLRLSVPLYSILLQPVFLVHFLIAKSSIRNVYITYFRLKSGRNDLYLNASVLTFASSLLSETTGIRYRIILALSTHLLTISIQAFSKRSPWVQTFKSHLNKNNFFCSNLVEFASSVQLSPNNSATIFYL